MSKIKTHKATAKRFSITGTGKIRNRKAGQDHFNARESGKTVRNKRRDFTADNTIKRTIKVLMNAK